MPERIQQILNRILEWWKNFNTRQKALIISIAAVVVVAFSILGYVVTRPTMVPLVTCTTADEAAKVKELLDDEKIAFEVSDDGMSYKINKDDQATASILLGQNAIPSDGYSLADALDGSFSQTEADKAKKYQLYLERKFADDLSTISKVSSAQVTLSIPKDDGTLLAQKEESHASVILTLKAGEEMDEEQAYGIALYIATELGNESTKHILLLDGSGNVLFAGGDEATTAGKATSNLSARQKAQTAVASAVKNVILGTNVYDNVEVGMNLVMNFDEVEETNYDYSVDEGRTEGYLDSRTESTSESASGVGGVPGTDTNDDDTTYMLQDGNVQSSTTSDITEDYLPDEKITNTKREVGKIMYDESSLTVVATNYVTYNEDELKANGTLDGTTFDEFVRENSARVKTEVDEDFFNMVSKATGVSVDNISIVAYDIPLFQYSEGSGRDLTDYLQIILAVLIFAMLGFVVFRTMRGEKEEELAEEVTVESLLEAQEDVLEDIGFSEKTEARLLIEKFVDENPEAVAALLRNWLNEDWG